MPPTTEAGNAEEAARFHREALQQHRRAKKIRAAVFGPHHMETALSIQQIGISEQVGNLLIMGTSLSLGEAQQLKVQTMTSAHVVAIP